MKTTTTTHRWESDVPPETGGVWARVTKSSADTKFQLVVSHTCGNPAPITAQFNRVTWDELRAIRDMLDDVLNDTRIRV